MTRSKVGNAVYYYCRTYKDQSKSACTKHTIKHIQLEAAVLYAIRQQVYLAVDFSKTLEQLGKVPLVKSRSKSCMMPSNRKSVNLRRSSGTSSLSIRIGKTAKSRTQITGT